MHLCDYGCGREAKFYITFKSTENKWCCKNHQNKCPEVRRKNSESSKGHLGYWTGKKRSESTKKKISEGNKNHTHTEDWKIKQRKKMEGQNNPMYGKIPWNKGKTNIYSEKTLKKMSENGGKTKGKTYEEIYGEEKAKKLKNFHKKQFSEFRKGKDPWNKDKVGIYSKETIEKISKGRTYNIQNYKNKHPIFVEVEQPRENNDVIEVKCKECKQWFTPTKIQIYERIRSLEKFQKNKGGFFFCCDKCKYNSPFYYLGLRLSIDQVSKFQKYNSIVYKETRKTIQKFSHKIDNINLRGIKYGYELDHKYSIYDGFQNKIKPKLIAHWKNLEILRISKNRSKNKQSSISLQELLSFQN